MSAPHERGPDDDAEDPAAAQARRRAEFMAAWGEDEAGSRLTPPLLVAGLVVLAWWALLGWQAWQWWPRADGATRIVAGIGVVERDARGGVAALRVGDGAAAIRFDCAGRGRPWRVLFVPVLPCRYGDVLEAADGRDVHVRYDEPEAGGHRFPRLLALAADGRALWTPDDSASAFGMQLWRGVFVSLLLWLPAFWLHRRWPRA